MKLYKIIMIFFLLVGCSSTNQLTKDELSNIKNVSVNSNVSLPENFTYEGPLGDGSTGGLIGALLLAPTNQKKSLALTNSVELFKKELRAKVFKNFVTQLKATNLFNILESARDARFEITVIGYGLRADPFPPEFFGRNWLKPVIGLKGVLRFKHKVIWEKSVWITEDHETVSQKYEKYVKKPETMQNAFNIATNLAISELVEHLQDIE